MAILTGGCAIVYAIYCRKRYYDITKLKLVKKWNKYKEVLQFAKCCGMRVLLYSGRQIWMNLQWGQAVKNHCLAKRGILLI